MIGALLISTLVLLALVPFVMWPTPRQACDHDFVNESGRCEDCGARHHDPFNDRRESLAWSDWMAAR